VCFPKTHVFLFYLTVLLLCYGYFCAQISLLVARLVGVLRYVILLACLCFNFGLDVVFPVLHSQNLVLCVVASVLFCHSGPAVCRACVRSSAVWARRPFSRMVACGPKHDRVVWEVEVSTAVYLARPWFSSGQHR